ncbi:MAG TPA: hypothetical protein VIY49_19750 [Bryobacteraceae bacterium]
MTDLDPPRILAFLAHLFKRARQRAVDYLEYEEIWERPNPSRSRIAFTWS